MKYYSLILLLICAAAKAQANEFYGYLGGEARYFFDDPLYPGQEDNNVSLSGYLEYYHDYDDRRQRLAATAFGRYDSADPNRSHLDLRELYWWGDLRSMQIFAGVRKVFWGVAESLHLVDVINQDDLVENIDQEDKLGQPMVQALWETDWGTFQAFALPYFRDKLYPGEQGRLRPALPIMDDPLFASGAERKHLDLALRWSHYFGVWDVGLSHFSGTNRDARFVPVYEAGVPVGLRPYYSQIEQTGLDAQATISSWLWKLELISVRDRDIGRYTAAVGGFEYTWYSLGKTNWDLGVVTEYQFDDRGGDYEVMNQNDVAAGLRWSLNDLAGTQVLALVSQDLEHDNRFYSLEASRRLTDDWEFSLEARAFSRIEMGTPEYDFRDDDYLQAELKFYF